MKIAASHIANLFAYGSYQGVKEPYLRTFLSQKTLDICDPQNFVNDKEFLTVFNELISKSKEPYFGLNYGSYLNIRALGFISEISLNASSIGQAVLILQEYLNSSFPLITLSVKEDKSYYTLQLDTELKDEEIKKHLLDIMYCFMFRELNVMLSDEFEPILQLPYDDIRAYSLQFDMSVQKGEKHQILLNRKILATEINQKKVKEIEYLLPKFMMMLESGNRDYLEFSRQVRDMTLNMCKPDIPTFDEVSKQFPLSDRTIQRRLKDEGKSFRKISNDIKRELSTYLRIGKQIKTQDIASILGYSDSSAYLHAVHKWKADF